MDVYVVFVGTVDPEGSDGSVGPMALLSRSSQEGAFGHIKYILDI